jgi:hypothetical protein
MPERLTHDQQPRRKLVKTRMMDLTWMGLIDWEPLLSVLPRRPIGAENRKIKLPLCASWQARN